MSVAKPKQCEQFIAKSDVLLVSNQHNKKNVMQFAKSCFRSAYGADVHDFLPNMLALLDNQFQIKASVGYQSAASNTLYLEHYLPRSIEETIAEKLNIDPPLREEILEVGNLASTCAGSTRRLILNLACHFEKQGYKWLVITATPHVRNSFEKLNVGLNLHPIANANADAVVNTNSDWGKYYEHQPQVYAGDIRSGITTLKSNPVLSKLLHRIKTPINDCNIFISDTEGAQ